MVALKWTMKNIYDIEPGEVFWAASDVGWVVGHSYIVYAPLFHGATTVLYEGKPVGTPDAGAFWRVIAQHKVQGPVHRAHRASAPSSGTTRTPSCMRKYDLSQLPASCSSPASALDPDTLHWAERTCSSVPVIDHWWQTETGWAIAANCMGLEPLPVKPGSPTKAVPGWDVHVLD